jgi:hypothetical protein
MIPLLFLPIVTTSPFYKDRNDRRTEICVSFDHAPIVARAVTPRVSRWRFRSTLDKPPPAIADPAEKRASTGRPSGPMDHPLTPTGRPLTPTDGPFRSTDETARPTDEPFGPTDEKVRADGSSVDADESSGCALACADILDRGTRPLS